MGLKEKLLAGRGGLRREAAAPAPELGEAAPAEGELFVRELSGAQRDLYEVSRQRVRRLPGGKVEIEPALENLRARLLVLCLVDAQGAQVFAGTDAAALGELPAVVLDRWVEQAARLSGLARGEEEDSLKNGSGAASSTDSPAA